MSGSLSLSLALAFALPALALASDGGHAEAVTPALLALAVMLSAAKLGGDLAMRAGQPSVLGELIAGVFLGNAGLAGIAWFEPMKSSAAVDLLAQLGVLLLLFQVGLESTVRDMLGVGLRAAVVAFIGVATPMALGWGVGALLLPTHGVYVHAFLGATLAATSVGITARVLRDLGRSQTAEARVILGAAVIDDVLGLVILAVVSGAIEAAGTGTALSYSQIGWIMGKAALFLAGGLGLGVLVSPRFFLLASYLHGRGVLLAASLVNCFSLAYAAARVGLAPIVGAYAAGLILEEVHFRRISERGEHHLEELLEPLASFLVPLFFVLMGMRVDLTAFANVQVLGLAALLTLAAIAGKQACALGALGSELNGLCIGIGMIPRGEVGLIFASIGMSLSIRGTPIVDGTTYSAVVIMVIVTTMVTPPALKWSFGRLESRLPR